VYVNVDQPRADDLACNVNLLRTLRCLARRISADGCHLPVNKQQVGVFIPSISWVD